MELSTGATWTVDPGPWTAFVYLTERPAPMHSVTHMATDPNVPATNVARRDEPLATERERVVQTLSTHFAHDRLTMTEFEHRLERAYNLTAVDELRSLVADLPAISAQPGTQEESIAPALVPSREVPPRGAIFAVMGGHERTGSWIVPRQLKVVVIMGGAEIDLREARFGAGSTEIEIFVLMGGVTIIVPPGVRVESLGAAVMGGFELKAGDATALSPTHPVLRLSGLAIMGGVETETRYPGETAKEAKRRRRRARSERG
jgi:Domain of unknown function (DUF1707)/Cell wall-active antibiotics response 4TMS YvqF